MNNCARPLCNEIGAGTSEILRMLIGREIFQETAQVDRPAIPGDLSTMAEDVSLELIGAQLERVLLRLDALQEDMRVLTTIVLRHDNTIADAVTQMRAMVSQHSRFNDRLRRLEEHPAE